MLDLRLVETIPGSLSDNNHINSCLIKLYTILYSYLYETNTFKLIVLKTSPNPGICLSAISSTASGVISLPVKPVPGSQSSALLLLIRQAHQPLRFEQRGIEVQQQLAQCVLIVFHFSH